ncbi:MAG: outer membrane protein assembly factor BamD [Caldimicrobium sp.]|nr:outer membrane protein assembly factor BamD [Caldimicrobium sp.]MDW8183502.1 outer membrane protein assembly factor BamD [Caldimicrobium sp.]
MNRRLLITFLGLLSSFFVSCAKVPDPLKLWQAKDVKIKEEAPLGELMFRAERYFQRGQYDLAYQYYEEVKNKYPGTAEAILAELRLGDTKFWAGEYLEAIALYEEFEKFYPNNEAIPYVIYQIGTSYYKLRQPTDRDQSFTKKAIENYQRLVQNFPQSPYNLEAEKRIRELRELLASQELYVANFYHRIKYYRGAYQRLLYLIEIYPETSSAQVARALLERYYRDSLKETEDINRGTKKDFFGGKVP